MVGDVPLGISDDFVNLEDLPTQSLLGAHKVELRVCIRRDKYAYICERVYCVS